jgi:hypothetical protein
LVVLSGCSSFEFDNDKDKDLLDSIDGDKPKTSLMQKLRAKSAESNSIESAVKKKIRWDGDGVVLGEIDSSVFSADSFRDTVDQLIKDERFSTIKNLVRKYPDVAITVLQEANPNLHDSRVLQLIAQNFDTLWCSSNGRQSTAWQSFIVDMTSTGHKAKGLLELKNQFWDHLKRDEPKKAIALKLVNNLPRETDIVVAAEFYRLESIAYMMDGEFSQATRRLRQSLEQLENVSPYQVARLKLLLGEFHRHNGELKEWKSSWAEAVNLQASLLQGRDLKDPSFWSRAAYLRPANTDWPKSAMDQLRTHVLGREVEIAGNMIDDSVVWMAIGLQHNDRTEGQHAVLAFKKSEAACGDKAVRDQLQLFQARAMLLAAQPGASSAILIRLISEYEGQPLADRAQAILGAMKLQNGAIGQGINLIQSSMKSVGQWPRSERLRAQADYGLALLVSGNEQEGLSYLDRVQQEFAALGEFDHAHQVLWNKAKYFEKTEQKQRFTAAQNELADVEKL